jgi:uncharacterized membrane protein YccC
MKVSPFTQRGYVNGAAIGETVAESFTLAIACLVTFEVTLQSSVHISVLSHTNHLLSGMWAVIATIFVYRLSVEDSKTAAVSRMAATLVSFVLCLAYLVVLPFTAWGMAALIGVGALIVTLLDRPKDAVTTGITTTVVMVVAALDPYHAWEQPILRLIDTAVGTLVGLAAAWISLYMLHLGRVPSRSERDGV